jgi:AraC-like DNA-binding protein
MNMPAADFATRKHIFPKGITVEQFTFESDSPRRVQVEVDQNRFGFFFCLSGGSRVGLKGGREKIQIRGGVCGAYAERKGMNNVAEYDAGEPYSIISLNVAPSTLSGIFGLDIEQMPLLAKAYRRLHGERAIIHFTQTRRSVTRALSDIINPPLDGRFWPVFAECKLIEILSIMLNDINSGNLGFGYPCTMTSAEITKIYSVRDQLLKNISDPPSLLHLAHECGLTHNKLTSGFRELFGSTVYEYLRQIRLEKARELLLSGDHNVTEVCYTVGYSNLSHFAKMYKQRYGESPSRSRKRIFSAY